MALAVQVASLESGLLLAAIDEALEPTETGLDLVWMNESLDGHAHHLVGLIPQHRRERLVDAHEIPIRSSDRDSRDAGVKDLSQQLLVAPESVLTRERGRHLNSALPIERGYACNGEQERATSRHQDEEWRDLMPAEMLHGQNADGGESCNEDELEPPAEGSEGLVLIVSVCRGVASCRCKQHVAEKPCCVVPDSLVVRAVQQSVAVHHVAKEDTGHTDQKEPVRDRVRAGPDEQRSRNCE
jgi:hypothetical protein